MSGASRSPASSHPSPTRSPGPAAARSSPPETQRYARRVFGRRRRTKTGRVKVTFSVTSDVVPGPFAEYPSREPGAAAVHAQVYETQREELNAMLVATGQLGRVFIAKVRAVRRPDGGEHTVTFWTKGV